ncbi:MGMT family protein, partial [Methanobrevibacter sp. OttesenSCG-928-I08]|nr:MGMT family protein [Methanobrevibacter sp. OttesenSCG-928-I08]
FESEYGSTNSYGELAELAGHPRAARAVGTTLAMNPFPIIIPCHRTIRHDKSIGQFGGGVESKMKLLELEKNNL